MSLTEDEVVEAVALHLIAEGWSIKSKLTTLQQGIDIVAERSDRPGRLLVEAEGGTSSKDHTARFGQPFSGRQVISHVSRAFYAAAALQEMYSLDQVAIALPDDTRHQDAIESIGSAITKLGVIVFFVADDRLTVTART